MALGLIAMYATVALDRFPKFLEAAGLRIGRGTLATGLFNTAAEINESATKLRIICIITIIL
jgi:hypothetical protein